MNPWRWVDPRVRSVHVADVKAYLLGRGWKLRPSANPNTLVFEEPSSRGGEPFRQAVPASEDFSDYPRHMAELITTLSEIEDRHPVELLNDILRQSSDEQAVVPARHPGDHSETIHRKRRSRPA